MLDQTPCADVSRAQGEPLLGTASRVRNWLLIQRDGSWGRDAVMHAALEDPLIRHLQPKVRRHRIRLLLIRRPALATEEGRRLFLVHSGVNDQWIQEVRAESADDIPDEDLIAMVAGRRPQAGTHYDEPIYLVCTHAEHDACCGRYGVAIAKHLAGQRPEQTWEVSHVGGDRFAANLVCMPHGVYFGRVTEPDSVEIATSYEDGRLELDHYRGRSTFDPVVQAADVFLRQREHLEGIDDLTFESRRERGPGRVRVVFRDRAGGFHEADITVRRAAARRITCAASKPGTPREYRFEVPAD